MLVGTKHVHQRKVKIEIERERKKSIEAKNSNVINTSHFLVV
jgi:hypothetical protein